MVSTVFVLKLVLLTLMYMVVFHLTQCQELPMRKNWLMEGFVTEAKDQEDCFSCWAFVTTGIMEWHYMSRRSNLLRFSEQYLIDCGKARQNLYGCKHHGGDIKEGLLAIRDLGIPLESDYPWINNDQKCRRRKPWEVYYYREYLNIKEFKTLSAEKLKTQLLRSVVGANVFVEPKKKDAWDGYDGTTIMKQRCSGKTPNHAVLLVGFDVDSNGEEYFLIKNSWGSAWGANGFGKLSVNSNENSCLRNFVYLADQ